MKSGRIHRFFDAFRQKLQILCRNQARLIQTLQVGDCFEEMTFSLRTATFSPGATCSVLLATRHAHLTRPSARLMSRAEVNKTTVLPAIFEQYLNKNFY